MTVTLGKPGSQKLPLFAPAGNIKVILLTIVFACSVLTVANNRAISELNHVPRGITRSDWAAIRAAYEAGRRAVKQSGTGYRARNPGQQWQTTFDSQGFMTLPDKGNWRWGLELRRFGFAGHEREVGRAEVVTGRVDTVVFEREDGLREWFINDQRGLEHGLTITRKPEGKESPLRFVLAVRGNLHPIVSSNGGDVSFVDAAGSIVLRYAGLHASDADGKRLPARFVASKREVILDVDERVARYPITVDPVAQQAYLKASNTDAGDFFGRSVAISGDTVVVGAYAEDSATIGVNGNEANNGAPDSGAAYVFVRTGTTWTQ